MSGSGGLPVQTTNVLGLLTAHGVDFVVIGGVAAVLHGGAQPTKDLDICFATDRVNLRALAKALHELDARPRGAPDNVPFVADEDTLRRIEVLTLRTAAGDRDVMTAPDGAPPYTQLRRRAERVDVGAFAVLVASIADLIAMKEAAGRPKDLVVVEELEAIQRLHARRSGR